MIVLYILISILAVVLLFILFTIICSYLIDTKKEYTNDSKFYRSLLNLWTGIALFFGRIEIETSGFEKLPLNSNFLVVGNHRSNFDPIITWYVLRKHPIAFISKEENFHVPFFGRIIRKCCFMAIDRENPKKAMETINHAADLLRNTDLSVGVYPEGTRNKTSEPLLPFHNGVFKIAKKANVPIVVITVKNTENIAKNFPLHSTKISFDVSDVIPAEVVSTSRTNEISEKVEKSLLKRLYTFDK